MNITQILNTSTEESSEEDILKKAAETVENLRSEYGNADYVIPMPDVDTVDGLMAFSALPVDSQLHLAKAAVARIRVEVIERVRQNPSLNIEKVSLEALATHPILTNLGYEPVSQYI